MAHDDELELTYSDFSRYPGSPGMGIDLNPPLPAYSEEDDDAVTLAMRPLEEQLAQPGPELTWGRKPAVASPPPVVMAPPAVVLPAPPVARAPSVRPPPVAPVPVAPPAFAAPAVASRPPPYAAREPQPSPSAPMAAARMAAAPSASAPVLRADAVPSMPAPVARAVVPASPKPAAVRAQAMTQTRIVRRPPKSDLLALAAATTIAALLTMLGTGAVLYRIGAFEPGSAITAH